MRGARNSAAGQAEGAERFIREDVRWGCTVASEAYKAVVCDAGPLIHLDELGCLQLLSDFAQCLVPDAVWEDVARHRPSAVAARGLHLERPACSRIPGETAALAALFTFAGRMPANSLSLAQIYVDFDTTAWVDQPAVAAPPRREPERSPASEISSAQRDRGHHRAASAGAARRSGRRQEHLRQPSRAVRNAG